MAYFTRFNLVCRYRPFWGGAKLGVNSALFWNCLLIGYYVVALETGSEQFQKTVPKYNWPKRKIPLCSLNCRLCGASCRPHICFLHELHVQFMQIYEKLMHCTCKSCKFEKRNYRSRVYMKYYQNGKSKNIMVFSAMASSTKHRPSFNSKTRLCKSLTAGSPSYGSNVNCKLQTWPQGHGHVTFCGFRFAVSHEKPDAKGPYCSTL